MGEVHWDLFRPLLQRAQKHLSRVTRIKLYLVATHTDLAAGLGFLSEGQKAFGPIEDLNPE